jgi:hypothetical protein
MLSFSIVPFCPFVLKSAKKFTLVYCSVQLCGSILILSINLFYTENISFITAFLIKDCLIPFNKRNFLKSHRDLKRLSRLDKRKIFLLMVMNEIELLGMISAVFSGCSIIGVIRFSKQY